MKVALLHERLVETLNVELKLARRVERKDGVVIGDDRIMIPI